VVVHLEGVLRDLSDELRIGGESTFDSFLYVLLMAGLIVPIGG